VTNNKTSDAEAVDMRLDTRQTMRRRHPKRDKLTGPRTVRIKTEDKYLDSDEDA